MKLRGVFLALGFVVLCGRAVATPWEVAVMFLSSTTPDPLYQKDIDHNIMELARSGPNENYRLSLYREFPDRAVSYFVDPKSSQIPDGAALFYDRPKIVFPVPGELTELTSVSPPLLQRRDDLKTFFSKAFRESGSLRLLVVFTHGYAFDGVQDLTLRDIKKYFGEALPARGGKPPLEGLWFDSCFMANLETVYQLRSLARYYLSSEESEFSAGAPFETFQLLAEGPSDVQATLLKFAEAYLTSYSLTKKGSQKEAVFGSSATLSVIDTAKLEPLVNGLGGLVGALRPLAEAERLSVQRSLKRVDVKLQDRTELLDLGNLLRHWHKRKKHFTSAEARDRVSSLLALLELADDGELQTNPRLRLEPPVAGSRVIFGYQNWTAGMQGDHPILDRLPESLTPAASFRLVPGPQRRNWPSRVVEKRLYVVPFMPGIDRFDYYFAKPEAPYAQLTERQTVLRTGLDYVVKRATHAGNPLLFSGYTQGVGKLGEKYTGLSILDPTAETVASSYSYLDFSEKTRWEELMLPAD